MHEFLNLNQVSIKVVLTSTIASDASIRNRSWFTQSSFTPFILLWPAENSMSGIETWIWLVRATIIISWSSTNTMIVLVSSSFAVLTSLMSYIIIFFSSYEHSIVSRSISVPLFVIAIEVPLSIETNFSLPSAVLRPLRFRVWLWMKSVAI